MVHTEKGFGESQVLENDRQRELVKRVIASATFAKSERLSSFLYYICDLSLSGQSSEINEQKIGEAIFGRLPDYDSSNDGIVRTHGSRLRQRLERYFSEEGAGEPVRIVIPRGGYVPVFEPRPMDTASPLDTSFPVFKSPEEESSASILQPKPIQEPKAPARSPRALYLAWGLVGVLAVLLASVLLRRSGRSDEMRAEAAVAANPLWSHLFVQDQSTLLVPGDSGLVIWEGLMGRRITLPEFVKGSYRYDRPADPRSAEGIASDLSNRRYTSIVDLEVMQHLSPIAGAAKSKLEMRYARDIRANDLKTGNSILVGATEANPWVELYEPIMNFEFSTDPVTHAASIYNRTPRANEPARWNLASGKAYAIVAYLPALGGSGNSLIIGGTSMTGTESALDFIVDDTQLLPFLKRIQHADGKLPHFQLVLGTNGMAGNAVRNDVLAWRTTD